MFSFGRKSRGSNWGSKKDSIKKGVKALGTALVVGAGVYHAATGGGGGEEHHKNAEAESSGQQEALLRHDKLLQEAKDKGLEAPAPAVQFGESGGSGKLDKARDALDIAGEAISAAEGVADEEGKLRKARAAAKGAKEVKDAITRAGKRDKQARFEAGALSERDMKKHALKQQKEAEKAMKARDKAARKKAKKERKKRRG